MCSRSLPARPEPKKAHVAAPVAAPVRILLVDNDLLVLARLKDGLSAAGYEVTAASDAQHALDALVGSQPHLALIGVSLSDEAGDELAHQLIEEQEVPFIFLAAGGKRDLIKRAKDLGALGYLV